jgi:hypothetical protein
VFSAPGSMPFRYALCAMLFRFPFAVHRLPVALSVPRSPFRIPRCEARLANLIIRPQSLNAHSRGRQVVVIDRYRHGSISHIGA